MADRAATAESLLEVQKKQLRLAKSHFYKLGREMTRAVTSAADYSHQTTLLQNKVEALVNENEEVKRKMSAAAQQLKYKDDQLSEFKKQLAEIKIKLDQKNKVC